MDTYEVPHLDIYLSRRRNFNVKKPSQPFRRRSSLCLSQLFETHLSELIGPITSAVFVRTYAAPQYMHKMPLIDEAQKLTCKRHSEIGKVIGLKAKASANQETTVPDILVLRLLSYLRRPSSSPMLFHAPPRNT